MTNIEKAEQFYKIAKEAYKKKDYEKAKQNYEKTIELDSNNFKAYTKLVILLVIHFEEHEKAKKYYEKAIEINPNFESTYNNLAILLTDQFDAHKKAKECYEKAIEIDSNDVDFYNNYANLIRKRFQKSKKKVTQINLKNYNQFNADGIIDLTYPEGHEKAGEPLDRICFIGQSGTGKSSLLELIKYYFTGDNVRVPNANFESTTLKQITYKEETDLQLINFSPYVVESIKQLNSDDIRGYEYKKTQNIIDFEKTDPKEHWYPIQKEITEYQKKVITKRLELTKKVENIKDVNQLQSEIDKYMASLNKWKKHTPNPLEKLDKFLEPLFSKFYIKVNTEPNNIDEIKFIPIESISYDDEGEKTKTDVHTEFLSTGTQQILSRIVPLFALKPKNTIILIDEPENSLYPNMQKEFIDFITQESWNDNKKTCQFFFATHSPTIASSFEPWEIVELKFNNKGKVVQKPYFEGERHVDNYTINPKYMRWDDVLIELFNTKHEGDEERGRKLIELSILERDIESGVYKGEEKQKKIKEFNRIANLLKWEL